MREREVIVLGSAAVSGKMSKRLGKASVHVVDGYRARSGNIGGEKNAVGRMCCGRTQMSRFGG